MSLPVVPKINGLEPGEYAAMWGRDTHYDPSGDGLYFYNFSSEAVVKTPEWLAAFAAAIARQIEAVQFEPERYDKGDDADLARLLEHVNGLRRAAILA